MKSELPTTVTVRPARSNGRRARRSTSSRHIAGRLEGVARHRTGPAGAWPPAGRSPEEPPQAADRRRGEPRARERPVSARSARRPACRRQRGQAAQHVVVDEVVGLHRENQCVRPRRPFDRIDAVRDDDVDTVVAQQGDQGVGPSGVASGSSVPPGLAAVRDVVKMATAVMRTSAASTQRPRASVPTVGATDGVDVCHRTAVQVSVAARHRGSHLSPGRGDRRWWSRSAIIR